MLPNRGQQGRLAAAAEAGVPGRGGRLLLLALLPALVLSACATPPSAPAGGAAATAAGTPAADLVIAPVHVVDTRAGRLLPDRAVVIREGRIAAVVAAGDAPAARQRHDGAQGYLMPGLWDMHAHLRAPGLPPPVTTEWMLPLLLAHGVTGVRDMNSACATPQQGPVCLPQMQAWQAQVARGERLGPRLLALSSWPLRSLPEQGAAGLVAQLGDAGVDLLKVYHDLDAASFHALAGAARARGLDFAGHVPLAIPVTAAAKAGMRSIEHARDLLYDCHPGGAAFRARATDPRPSVAQMRAMVDTHDPARCARVLNTLAATDTWYVPTHLTRRMEAYADDADFRNDPRNRYVPAPLLAGWQRDADGVVAAAPTAAGRQAFRDFYEAGLAITAAAHAAGVGLLVGTDGGDSYVYPGSAVHDELAELVRAGLTPAEALRAATWNSAVFLGRQGEHGLVAPGQRADLLLLAANPLEDIAHTRQIQAVLLGGELMDRARLDALLAQAEGFAAALGQP